MYMLKYNLQRSFNYAVKFALKFQFFWTIGLSLHFIF